jgi:hypothetical protein
MTRRIEMLNPSFLDYKNELSEDDILNRYCSIAELYQTVKGSLSLSCPFSWDDPFENWLFRAKLIGSKGNNIDLHAAGTKFYCQSWTLNDESDAMWRLYASRNNGVRISTTTSKLYFEAYNAYDIDLEPHEFVQTKIGKVIYKDEIQIREEIGSPLAFKDRFMELNCEGHYDSLLIKRLPYKFENEVRLIAHDFDGRFGCTETTRLAMPIGHASWIESITFGPETDDDTFIAHQSRLIDLGIDKVKIERSNLYGPLSYTINLSSASTESTD